MILTLTKVQLLHFLKQTDENKINNKILWFSNNFVKIYKIIYCGILYR
jgi:hypothetical protein